MLRLYIPVAVGVLIIAVGTYFEAANQDRFSTSAMTAEEFGKRFVNIPKVVGDWVGEDVAVDDFTREEAGAVNHVNRSYYNKEKRAGVDLWLIVGHARDVCRHTPDICYPAHGMSQQGEIVKQPLDVPGEGTVKFNTAKFHSESGFKDSRQQRVFWTWNGNEKGLDTWDAPVSQRFTYGNNPSLYKMYFTTNMAAIEEPAADSVALEFARLMIPKVNRALFPERYVGQAAAEPPAAAPPSTDEANSDKS